MINALAKEIKMKKVSSLDFLNKKKFSIDVYLENGVLVFPEGSEITPDILLRAYFKNLYIRDEDERKFLELDNVEDQVQTPAETERKSKIVEDVLGSPAEVEEPSDSKK